MAKEERGKPVFIGGNLVYQKGRKTLFALEGRFVFGADSYCRGFIAKDNMIYGINGERIASAFCGGVLNNDKNETGTGFRNPVKYLLSLKPVRKREHHIDRMSRVNIGEWVWE